MTQRRPQFEAHESAANIREGLKNLRRDSPRLLSVMVCSIAVWVAIVGALT